jgi:lipopolysaccharide export system protein LptA
MRGGRECGSTGVWAGRFRRPSSSLLPILSLLSLLSPPARAQARTVEILNADSVTVEQGPEGTVRRLVGGVRLRQDTTTIEAPRAVQYVERGEVVLDGPVRIRSGDVTLTADRVTYTAGTKIAAAAGAVRITDGEGVLTAPAAYYAVREELAAFDTGGRLEHEGSVLTAPRGTYDTDRRFAAFEGSIRLEDSTVVLTAERGTYDARARLATFRGDVRLVDSTSTLTAARGTYRTRLQRADFGGDVRLDRPAAAPAGGRPGRAALHAEADSLVHFRREERTLGWGRVVLERIGGADDARATDSTRRTVLFGAYAAHDEPAGRSEVAGADGRDPLAVLLRTDSTGRTDTTLARAPRLLVVRLDTLGRRATRLTAGGGARLAAARFAAVADSAALLRLDSTATTPATDRLLLLGGRPVAWAEGAQLTADTLLALGTAGEPDSLLALGSPFAAQLDSTLGRVRQLRGRRMLALFGDEDGGPAGGERRLRRLSVWPNAEAVYYRATADGRLAGAERLSADSLAFHFRRGELREIRGARGIEGTSYGAGIVPPDLRLTGYAFDPDGRPTRDALLPPGEWEAAWLDARTAPPAPPQAPPDAPPAPSPGE